RGGADEREGLQLDPYGARGRTLADHEVKLEILHRRIEHLLHRRVQSVDLVDEEDIARLEVGQNRREVAGTGEDGPRGHAEVDAELLRHDLRQRGLAEAWGAVEKRVVHRLAAPPRA